MASTKQFYWWFTSFTILVTIQVCSAQYLDDCEYECSVTYCDPYEYCDYECYEVCYPYRSLGAPTATRTTSSNREQGLLNNRYVSRHQAPSLSFPSRPSSNGGDSLERHDHNRQRSRTGKVVRMKIQKVPQSSEGRKGNSFEIPKTFAIINDCSRDQAANRLLGSKGQSKN